MRYPPAVHGTPGNREVSAYYWAPVPVFLAASPAEVIGQLTTANTSGALEGVQVQAWAEELDILCGALLGLQGTLYLEFGVPRLGSRIDAALISGPAVFPIEFKCGESKFTRDAYDQAWDYALDLKNFHSDSHRVPIFPIVVATRATHSDEQWLPAHADGVRPPRRSKPADLRRVVEEALREADGPTIDGEQWGRSSYQPTPTIIEAARALYARHTVAAITRNDAGAINLTVTSRTVEGIIEQARARREKAIVFVTGVPGAGKTLVGLNVATSRRQLGDARAVFLSGNQPLVSVLREALTRDELRRRAPGTRKGTVLQEVKPFIQNIHHFRDEGVRTDSAPDDHVVIFDEAQRAWDRQQTAAFMKRRKGLADFPHSEPEFLISYLDRHKEWAVIVCLVGGGQEIHTGEAGIGAWLEAVEQRFGHWHTYVSTQLSDSEYAASEMLDRLDSKAEVTRHDGLHLATSMRSFRSEKVSAFVKAVLDHDTPAARATLKEVTVRYPMAITRDLARAKRWIRGQARGSEQVGLVASSQAMRLKPHAIDVRAAIDPIHWFLADRSDTRCSNYLEDAATEFQIQGLEVDWTCVTWDADLRMRDDRWQFHSFRGHRWESINKPTRQRYLLNAYRVLLTRARQGMVIFVPTGESADPTRAPAYYDETYDYLSSLGIQRL
jgi:hypothetical protein